MVPEDTATPNHAPELVFFRSGKWRIERPRTNLDHSLLSSWRTSTVVPLSDGSRLCWVDKLQGIIFYDVFDETPTLRYLPYPREARAPHVCYTDSFCASTLVAR